MATPEQIAFTQVVVQGQYPQFKAYFQIPELANLITDSLIARSSPDEIIGKVLSSNWWTTTPQAQRDFYVGQVRDPATADAAVTQKAEFLRLQMSQLGMPYDWNELRFIAYWQISNGFSDQQGIQRAVEHFGSKVGDQALGGIIGNGMTSVQSTAREFAVKVSDQQSRFLSTLVATGQATQATVEDFMRDQAKSMYPYLSNYLDQGVTVRQFADPYIQQAASELEINPTAIDLTDPKWGRVLQPVNGQPASLYDWTRLIRTDPSYGYDKTTGARTQSAQFATSLMRSFGALG